MSRPPSAALRVACVGLLTALLAACGDGPADSQDALAGTYRVDKQHYRALLHEELTLKEGQTLEQPALHSLELYLEQMQIDLVLLADGTWTLKGNLAAEALDDRGTWTIVGDEIRFRFTHQNGQPAHKTVTGRREADGAVFVQPSAEMSGPFRMLRQ